ADHGVVDELEDDLDAGSIRNERRREPAWIDVERRVPGMVKPWRPRQPVLADNLAIKMQRGAGLAPWRIRDIGPGCAHGVSSFISERRWIKCHHAIDSIASFESWMVQFDGEHWQRLGSIIIDETKGQAFMPSPITKGATEAAELPALARISFTQPGGS